MQLENKFMFIK